MVVGHELWLGQVKQEGLEDATTCVRISWRAEDSSLWDLFDE